MKRIRNNLKFLFFIFICLFTMCNTENAHIPLNVIPLENEVGRYNVLNLSDYVTDICYIPLETNDSVLIAEIRQIIYENGKIVVLDRENGCMVFDDSGRFCNTVGSKGQGPNEYIAIRQVYIANNCIHLYTVPDFLLQYDMNGILVKKITLPKDLDEFYFVTGVCALKKDIYVLDVCTMANQYYPKALLFETKDSTSSVIMEFPNYIHLKKDVQLFTTVEYAIMYSLKDEIRSYKPMNCDTIFTIGQNMEIKEAFIFDLGKYKPSLAFFEMKDRKANVIFPSDIKESLNYLFITWQFGVFAPEPIVQLRRFPDGSYKESVNSSVYAVFDKNNGKLSLMSQPVKDKPGFRNDMDDGPVIWPHYISTKNEIVTFIASEDFLEYVNQLDYPDSKLTKIAEQIFDDDNPVVIIAKLKE